jgi:alanyl-tRNA synthetase
VIEVITLSMISDDTRVTFPGGSRAETSPVLAAFPYDGMTAVVCAQTPFHPVDHRWPDQPGDHGTLHFGQGSSEVVDCLTGAVHAQTGEVMVGTAITVRRGDPEWHWTVLHIVQSLPDVPWEAASAVRLTVNESRRAALSAAHSACHLSGLALNDRLAELWSPDRVPQRDSLGFPDFDGTALTRSEISETGFRDTYRLGKSLRKSGFQTARVADLAPALGDQLTARAATWIEAAAKVWIETGGTRLSGPRTWHCALPEGEASIACGGTHPDCLAVLGTVRFTVSLSADGMELAIRGDLAAAEPQPAQGE